jgi:hypothetical protein
MGYDTPPPVLVQKCPGGILPCDPHSREAIDGAVMGQVYVCKPRKGRTQARNAAYWAGLGAAVRSTDAWPTATHLHHDLKRLCGYVETWHNPLTRQDEIRVQSTAFDKMGETEFSAYFRLAQARFIACMGFDPWQRNET